MGVKPQTDTTKAYLSYLFANYLSGYVGQIGRFESNGWGPSNKAAQADPNVTTPALQALALQGAYATPQGNYPGSWWNNAGAIGNDLYASGGDVDVIKKSLSNYAGALDNMLNAHEPDWENTQVSIIGKVASLDSDPNGWTVDTDLTPNSGYTTFTKKDVVFAAGEEWKIRLDHKWDTAYGVKAVTTDSMQYVDSASTDNIIMGTAGTYDVSFSTDTKQITITPAA